MTAFLRAFARWFAALIAAVFGPRAASAVEATPPATRAAPRRPPPEYTHAYPAVREVGTQAEARAAVEAEDALAIVRGEVGHKWLVMRCPCGCGEIRRVSLSPSVQPAWRYAIDRGGHVSLYPSVDLTSACRAHFILRRNIAFGC